MKRNMSDLDVNSVPDAMFSASGVIPKIIVPYLTKKDLDQFLIECIAAGVSDITLQSGVQVFVQRHGKTLAVSQRVLGAQEIADCAQYIYGANAMAKLMSGHDVDVSYVPSGNIGQKLRFRVNMTPCEMVNVTGIQISFRAIALIAPKLSQMLLPEVLEEALLNPVGLSIIAGSTGSGKSTLLAALIQHMLNAQDAHFGKILTYEAPVEYIFQQKSTANIIAQTEVPRSLPDFAYGVRNAMRRHPDLIMVGETRDPQTLMAVIEATLTGHPVMTTLHGKGVSDVLQRAVMLVPTAQQAEYYYHLIQSLHVIVWQRLLPRAEAFGGGLLPVREYLIMTDALRLKLLGLSLMDSYCYLREYLKDQGMGYSDQLSTLKEEGKIEDAVYRRFQV